LKPLQYSFHFELGYKGEYSNLGVLEMTTEDPVDPLAHLQQLFCKSVTDIHMDKISKKRTKQKKQKIRQDIYNDSG